MKKRILFVGAISLLTLSLTACQFIEDYINDFLNFGGSGAGKNSFSQVVASSRQPISDVSTPPASKDVAANHADKNYSDLVANSIYAFSCTPSTGSAKLLVIPVWFNNSDTFIKTANRDKVKEDIHSVYFGTNSDVGWRSVKTYYEEESHGALTLNGTVSDWYEINKSHDYYAGDSNDPSEGTNRTVALVEQATDWYFNTNTSESRRDYDADNDGYLDGVMLIYAAPDYGTLKKDRYQNLWAYCYWVQDPTVQKPSNPGVNAFFWASYDFMYGNEVASSRTGTSYCAGDTSHAQIDAHTYVHEMGHMFGLEDYYDYSSRSYSPAGGFSMQDFNVGGHDPFSSFALGWGKAYVPTKDEIIDLKPFSTSGEMILLTPSWNAYNSPFDEYILLEYYTDTGLNELDSTYGYMSQYGKKYPIGTKDYGIRVWHVDARLLYTSTGEFSPSKITTNPSFSSGRVAMMMSNTYDDGSEITRQYVSPLSQDPTSRYYDSRYAQFNLLQLIRNDTKLSSKTKDYFTVSSLFKAGDVFTMSNYSSQFVNAGKLDSNTDLGFSFEINACNNTYASISIKKL